MASGQDANPNLLPLLRGKLETVHAEIQQLNVSPGFARGGLRLCGRGRRRSPHARRVSAARAARGHATVCPPPSPPPRAAQADLDAFKARIDSKTALAAKAAAAAGVSPAPGGAAGGSRGQTQESVRRRIDVRCGSGGGGGGGGSNIRARAGEGGRKTRCARARGYASPPFLLSAPPRLFVRAPAQALEFERSTTSMSLNAEKAVIKEINTLRATATALGSAAAASAVVDALKASFERHSGASRERPCCKAWLPPRPFRPRPRPRLPPRPAGGAHRGAGEAAHAAEHGPRAARLRAQARNPRARARRAPRRGHLHGGRACAAGRRAGAMGGRAARHLPAPAHSRPPALARPQLRIAEIQVAAAHIPRLIGKRGATLREIETVRGARCRRRRAAPRRAAAAARATLAIPSPLTRRLRA